MNNVVSLKLEIIIYLSY